MSKALNVIGAENVMVMDLDGVEGEREWSWFLVFRERASMTTSLAEFVC